MNAERASGRWAGAIGVAVVLSLASASAAQSGRQTPAPWRTPPGGDASGDYVGVRYIEDVGELRGTRRVERVDVRDGYTTGSTVIVVLAGAEPEPSRSFRVHLPYGARASISRRATSSRWTRARGASASARPRRSSSRAAASSCS